jgi:hypothetical protein
MRHPGCEDDVARQPYRSGLRSSTDPVTSKLLTTWKAELVVKVTSRRCREPVDPAGAALHGAAAADDMSAPSPPSTLVPSVG